MHVARIWSDTDSPTENAAYLCHAANSYPRLVEALQGVELIARVNSPITDGSPMHKAIVALLRSLGEIE
jgi:hypothetical protein